MLFIKSQWFVFIQLKIHVFRRNSIDAKREDGSFKDTMK